MGQPNSAYANSLNSFHSNSTVSRHSTQRFDVPSSNSNKRKRGDGYEGGGGSRGARMMRVGNRSTDKSLSEADKAHLNHDQGSASALRNVADGAVMLTSPTSQPSDKSMSNGSTSILGSPSEEFSSRYRSV